MDRSVVGYGAVPNDAGDDLAAINAALLASLPGDRVVFPQGNYRVSGTIVVPRSGVQLVGAGRDSTSIRWAGSARGPMVLLRSITDVTVSGLTLDGGGSSVPTAGIHAQSGVRLTFAELAIRDFPAAGAFGIYFENDVSDSIIRDDVITNIGVGSEYGAAMRIALRSARNQILRNVITNTGRGGILCNDGSSDNVIRGNRVSGTGIGRPSFVDALSIEVWQGCDRSVIEDNEVDHWLSVNGSPETAVRRNTVRGRNGFFTLAGLELAEGGRAVFTDNIVDGGAAFGISASGSEPKDFVYWGHNRVSGAGTFAVQVQGESGGARYHYFYDDTFSATLPPGGPGDWNAPAHPEWSGHGFRLFDNVEWVTFDHSTSIGHPGAAVQLLEGYDEHDLPRPVSNISFLDAQLSGRTMDLPRGAIAGLEWVNNRVTDGFTSEPNLRARPPLEILVRGALVPGQPVSFSVVPSTDVANVLWDFGAGPASFALAPSFTYEQPGTYEVTAIAWSASGVGRRAHLTLRIGSQPSRLANLSVRAVAGPAEQTLIVGAANRGGAKSLLVRGVGPGLSPFGVASVLPNPNLTVFRDSTVIQANEDWGSAPNAAAIAQASSNASAFSLAPLDAAVLGSFADGAYTVQISGAPTAASGVALAEIYDVDASASAARLVNVSGRARVGTGENVIIAGFELRGERSRKVLIRGVGPTLAGFGVPNTLAEPELVLYRGQTELRRNAQWSTDPLATQMAQVAMAVSAFPLATTSQDAAMLVTLAPGTYTVQLRGERGGTGVALVELYDAEEALEGPAPNARVAAMYAMPILASTGGGTTGGAGGTGGTTGGTGGSVACDDGNPCTVDTNTGSGCTFTAVSCDDGNPCTSDACVASSGQAECRHVDNGACPPPNLCAGVSCDDGNGCSLDWCENGACHHAPNPCDDGDPCTIDWCSAHACFNAPIIACASCDDGDPCTDDSYVGGRCEHVNNGSCPPPDPCGGCDDGDPCTMDFCMAFHCMHWDTGACTPTTDPCAGVSCDDGSPCTDDWCEGGACHSSDNGSCTADLCAGVSCEDGSGCTDDWCEGGACYSNDNGSCTSDPCAGVSCDDGDPCTDDWCSGGGCGASDNGACSGGGGGDQGGGDQSGGDQSGGDQSGGDQSGGDQSGGGDQGGGDQSGGDSSGDPGGGFGGDSNDGSGDDSGDGSDWGWDWGWSE